MIWKSSLIELTYDKITDTCFKKTWAEFKPLGKNDINEM